MKGTEYFVVVNEWRYNRAVCDIMVNSDEVMGTTEHLTL
jgi:hypothetical protein